MANLTIYAQKCSLTAQKRRGGGSHFGQCPIIEAIFIHAGLTWQSWQIGPYCDRWALAIDSMFTLRQKDQLFLWTYGISWAGGHVGSTGLVDMLESHLM